MDKRGISAIQKRRCFLRFHISISSFQWVHPWLTKHERDIDFYLEQAKAEGYNQVLSIGTKGLMCAREIMASAALRGQEHLAQQLQRSYSLNDVSKRTDSRAQRGRDLTNRVVEEEWQEEPADEPDVRSWAGPSPSVCFKMFESYND